MLEAGPVFVGTEPGMGEADQLTLVRGNNQSLRVKINLRQHSEVEGVARDFHRRARAQARTFPERNQGGHIAVMEGAVIDQGSHAQKAGMRGV